MRLYGTIIFRNRVGWFFNLRFYLKLPFNRIDRILIQQPAIGHRIYPTPQFHISHSAPLRGMYSPRCGINLHIPCLVIPFSSASWDVLTTMWNKSPYPMPRCWISYIIIWLKFFCVSYFNVKQVCNILQYCTLSWKPIKLKMHALYLTFAC